MSPDSPPEAPPRNAPLRRAGIAAFLAGAATPLAFLACFPGLPHVIDWGAIITALAVGTLARRAYRAHITRKHTRPE